MTAVPCALEGIWAWFVANEAALAVAAREDREMPPELMIQLDGLLGAASSALGNEWPRDALAGRAVGACFAWMPTAGSLDAARSVLHSGEGWAAFSEGAAAEACGDVAVSARLEACLGDLVDAFTWAPRRIVDAHRVNMCALAERYRTQPRLGDVWRPRHHRTMLVRHEPAFDALRVAEPDAFLRLLDRFPHPEPGRHILSYSSGRMDLDELLKLLRRASAAFAEDVWLPNVKSPLLVLAAVEEKLSELAGADGGPAAGPSEAFATAVARVLAALSERTDRNELGHAWLQRLLTGSAFRSRRDPGDDRRHACLRYLTHEVASKLSPRRDAVRWVRAEQEVWRRDRAVAALAAGLGRSDGQGSAMARMRNLLAAGLHVTGQDAGLSDARNAERGLLATLIGRHPEPAGWFRDLWRSMAHIRDRARHEGTSAGGRDIDATLIAVTWFLCGLDAVAPDTQAHRALWRSLLQAVREGVQAQTSPMAQEAWRARYRFLAAHLAGRLLSVGDTAASDDLRDLLAPLLCLDMTLAEVVHVLAGAGVPAHLIASAGGGTGRLAALLRRLTVEQEWREGRQQEKLGSRSRFSQSIALIADTIDGSPIAKL